MENGERRSGRPVGGREMGKVERRSGRPVGGRKTGNGGRGVRAGPLEGSGFRVQGSGFRMGLRIQE